MQKPDHSLLATDVTPMINDVRTSLSEWQTARSALTTAVNSYLMACGKLTTTCTRPAHLLSERDVVEDAFVIVDSELGPLSSEIKSLRDAQISMCTLRNRSGKLTRINALPPEVLTHIFKLSKTYCLRDSKSKGCYNALAEVDAYWRQIALDIPELWTHVDVSPNTPTRSLYSLSKTMFERTKGELVHLHVHEARRTTFGGPTPEVEIKKLKDFILPYIPQISALQLHTETSSHHLIRSVLDLWKRNGLALLNDLRIYIPDSDYSLYLGLDGLGFHVEQSAICLQKLYLQNAHVDWRVAICHLTDLRLESAPSSYFDIDVTQLATTLAGSPKLAVLKLCEISVTGLNSQNLSPIMLENLQVLNLIKLNSDTLKLILPLIAQPNPAAQLSVGLIFYEDDLHDEYQGFFSRCHISSLYYESPTEFLSLPDIPLSISHLVISRSDLSRPPFISEGQVQSQPRFIIYVTLVSCVVTLEGLVDLVPEMGVRVLNLDCCVIGRLIDGPVRAVTQEVASTLLEIYPDLVCNVSDVDTTAHLPCRTMFES